MKIINILFCLFVFSIPLAHVEAQDFKSDQLPIGDIHKKYDLSKVTVDRILNTTTNTETSFEEMIQDLRQVRIVMIGETHTNQYHHDIQLEVIKGLVESGKPVVLALEMYNPSQNQQLVAWSSGVTDPNTFMEQTGYLSSWGHNYRYYKAIFDYAREKNLAMYGANVKREYASKIGRGGLEILTDEEIKFLPHVDTSTTEHKFLINILMEGMGATMPQFFRNMYAAQCLWDCAMGEGAIQAAHDHPEATVVVLAGSGHVVYNLGIGRVIDSRSNLSFASIVPVDVEISDIEEDDAPSAHGMGSGNDEPGLVVSRSYGDFLWGKPKMGQEKYPSLGISLDERSENGFPVKRIFPGTIAYANGLRTGDLVLSINGESFNDLTGIKKYLQYVDWDDQISFLIMREDEKLEMEFTIAPLD